MNSINSGARGNDIWGWHDGDQDYAIVGLTTGSSFVRITDPENPEVLGFLPTHTSSSTWRDMKVINDHAFIVSEALGHGMQVSDLQIENDVVCYLDFKYKIIALYLTFHMVLLFF